MPAGAVKRAGGWLVESPGEGDNADGLTCNRILRTCRRRMTAMTVPPPFVSSLPSPIHPCDPGAALAERLRQLADTGQAAAAELNLSLTVEVHGLFRFAGDWLGVAITPGLLHLVLFPGGGTLWGDIPVGQKRYLNLPCGTLAFTAVEDSALGVYQCSPLVENLRSVPDMAAARAIALDALKMIFAAQPSLAPVAPTSTAVPAPVPAPVSRRGFFRRLSGRG